MMTPLALLLVTACAAPAPAAAPAAPAAASSPALPPEDGRVRALLLDLTANNVDPGTTRTLGSMIAVELHRYPEIDVLTADDMRRSVELESTRASMGCDTNSCLAELADSLGAQIVFYGDVGKLGDDLVLNLSLFDTGKMTSLSRITIQVSDTKRMGAELRPKLHELLTPFYASRGLPLVVDDDAAPAVASSSGPGVLPWVVVGTGAVVGIAGVVVAGLGFLPLAGYLSAEGQLTTLGAQSSWTADDYTAAETAHEASVANREAWNTLGVGAVVGGAVLATAGVAAVAAGILWALGSGE